MASTTLQEVAHLLGRFVEEGEEDRDGRQARDRLQKGSVVLVLFHVDHGGMGWLGMPERLECCFADEIVVFLLFGDRYSGILEGLFEDTVGSFESDVTAGQMRNEVRYRRPAVRGPPIGVSRLRLWNFEFHVAM